MELLKSLLSGLEDELSCLGIGQNTIAPNSTGFTELSLFDTQANEIQVLLFTEKELFIFLFF